MSLRRRAHPCVSGVSRFSSTGIEPPSIPVDDVRNIQSNEKQPRMGRQHALSTLSLLGNGPTSDPSSVISKMKTELT